MYDPGVDQIKNKKRDIEKGGRQKEAAFYMQKRSKGQKEACATDAGKRKRGKMLFGNRKQASVTILDCDKQYNSQTLK